MEESQRNTDEFYMREALKQARLALSKDEIPIGAVIVCNRQIIAKGYNLSECLTDVTAHAEMQAFTSASAALGSKYLKDCTLYVTVEPCLMCAGAAYWTQISRIVYGTSDPKRGYSLWGETVLHPKTMVTSGVLEEECKTLISSFFSNKRKLSI